MKRLSSYILLGLSFVLLLVALYSIFIFAPPIMGMALDGKIFYIMVPMGWLAMLSFTIIFVASILYLKRKEKRWDTLANSAGQVGILFTTLTILTRSIWAKAEWGDWWTPEPRLMATLVLWLIYVAYFMVRSFATEESRGATFAAVVGIVGFVDVPIIGMSTTLWRGMHPRELVFEGKVAVPFLPSLIVSLLAFTALYVLLLMQTVAIKNDEVEIRALKEQGN